MDDSISTSDNNNLVDTRVSSRLTNTIPVPEEDFDTFFIKFDTDSTFQYSRIEFPLSVINESATRFLSKQDWKFTTLSNKQAIKGQINKVKISREEVKVEYTIEDTGVLVNHVFHTENGKWWLLYIQDESD